MILVSFFRAGMFVYEHDRDMPRKSCERLFRCFPSAEPSSPHACSALHEDRTRALNNGGAP